MPPLVDCIIGNPLLRLEVGEVPPQSRAIAANNKPVTHTPPTQKTNSHLRCAGSSFGVLFYDTHKETPKAAPIRESTTNMTLHVPFATDGIAKLPPYNATFFHLSMLDRLLLSILCQRRFRSGFVARSQFFRVILLLLALMLVVSPSTVGATMIFNPTNVMQASMYQTIQLKLTSNPLKGDPSIANNDEVYLFLDPGSEKATHCQYNLAEQPKGVNHFKVTDADSEGYLGYVEIPILSDAYSEGASYVLCYLSQRSHTATVLRRPSDGSGSTALLIWPVLYKQYSLSPPSASGGEGMVSLSLFENELVEGRPHNDAFHESFTIFLAPCDPKWDCTDLNALTMACNAVGKDLEQNGSADGVVLLSYLSHPNASSVAGKFVVPYLPSRNGYYICTPYCPSGAFSCGTARASMSFTVVATVPPVLKFSPASPGTYSRTPEKPQAREEGSITFYGTGLSSADNIKIIKSNDQCTSASSSMLDGIQFSAVEYTPEEGKITVEFVRLNLLDETITGRVCYWRKTSNMWSSAYLSKDNQNADFTIDPLQPSHIDVLTPSPVVGQVITVKFTGTGLDGSADKAFLSSTAVSKSCTETPSGEDLFVCNMSGTTTPLCNVNVDASSKSEAKLFVYYCKVGRLNYAQLRDTVSLAARNPVYTLSSYPMYAGQFVGMEFTGKGLSADDEVMLLEYGKLCGDDAQPSPDISLTSLTEVKAGEAYRCDLVGHADRCLTVCYHLAQADAWVAVHSGERVEGLAPASCPATALFIAAYPGRYAFPAATRASPITVYETASIAIHLTPAPAPATVPRRLKVVRSADACVLTLCSGRPACATAAAAADFIGPFTPANRSADVWLAETRPNYVVCIALTEEGAFVPVLPATTTTGTKTGAGEGADPLVYGFRAAARNPVVGTRTPPDWRVGMVRLATVFTGVGLSAARDRVFPVAASTLLREGVCPPLEGGGGTTPPILLGVTLHPESSTATAVNVTYTRSDLLSSGKVHFCYQWTSTTEEDAGEPKQRISYAGSVSLGPAVPTTFTLTNVPFDGNYYATDSVTMVFNVKDSGDNVLSASSDAVYFYRFDTTLYPDPNCYCDPSTCPSELRTTYSDAIFTNTSEAVVPGSEVNYTNIRGFRNYQADTTYVVCYSVGFFAHADMYLGRLSIKQANPMYYTLLQREGTVNHAGEVISIFAYRCRAASRCNPLTKRDEMILVPSTVECASVFSNSTFTDVVQRVGNPIVAGNEGYTYLQRFVVNHAGTYRVCYRRNSKGDGGFAELAFTSKFLDQPVEVVKEDPSSFEAVPKALSEGQFLTINLQCSQDECSSCNPLRLIEGEGASCWDSEIKKQTYISEYCLTTTSIQFPDQYIMAGTYTVCYGDGSITNTRRLPGTLVVSKANPLSYNSVPNTDRTIFTNQVANFILNVKGEGLGVDDDVFLLTAKTYSCHDLRTFDVQNNRTLRQWLSPSVNPYPLQKTSDGVLWVVSNITKRFGMGMLYDQSLCDRSGGPCEMKLCYKRSGTSWATVPIESLPPIQIKLPDPSTASFDSSNLISNMYVMVTVSGSGLTHEDSLVVNTGIECDTGAATAAVLVGEPAVNEAGTQWLGVLRLLGGGANSYTLCYTRKSGTISEINDIKFPDSKGSDFNILPSPLYAVYSKQNFTSLHYAITKYEEMMVTASFKDDGSEMVPLTNVQLIYSDSARAECNYAPFFEATNQSALFPIIVNFTEASAGSGVFQGRLAVNSDTYMLCMNTSKGLFRVDSLPSQGSVKTMASMQWREALDIFKQALKNLITIHSECPNDYDTSPKQPMLGHTFQFNFFYTSTTPSVTNQSLAVGDIVQIIDGSLFDCGFRNTTILSEGLVSSITSTSDQVTALAELNLPDSITDSTGAVLTNKSYNFTVCYRKQSGTFATVPRLTATVDRNLLVMPVIPAQWTFAPMQLQAGVSANLSFLGSSDFPDYFSTKDSAFLVRAPSTRKSSPSTALCQTSPPVLISTAVEMDGINTVWRIPSGKLEEGDYIVCYTAAKNKEPGHVPSPGTLVVYPLQSPTGAYANNDAHSNALHAYRGERFYIFFNTSEELHVVLDDGLTPSSKLAGRDVVRISPHRDCRAPLQSDKVAQIPDAFGYKPLETATPSATVPVPYIHLRVRAESGNYFVCMQRTGREPWQAYYNSSLVGNEVHPAVLTITDAPITQFTTTPASPRVLVERTNVHLTFTTGYKLSDFKQLFFVPFSSDPASPEDEISHDNCYRPATRSEAVSEAVVLLNNSLQVNFTTMNLDWSFSDTGTYLLCFQLSERPTVASAFPSTLTVLNPSPNFYEVPLIISKGSAFSMSFAALDPIFKHRINRVDIYALPDDVNIETMPSCVGATPPSGGGTTSFTSFAVTNNSYASVNPIINDSGYFFVCFLTYDQSMSFPVPNHAGDFSFAVGITGAQKYEVSPSPSYLGQILNISIKGNLLSDKDHVKIVRILSKNQRTFAYMQDDSIRLSYRDECSASSINADASAPPGDTAGSVVESINGIVAYYFPRVNATGSYVLCYQSSPLGNIWGAIEDPELFITGEAHPSSYLLQPDPVYKTQIAKLVVQDSAGLLQAQDRLKLVASQDANKVGFRCDDAVPTSSDIVIIEFVASESTKNASVYRVCGKNATSVVVCYQLAGTGTWAEVPQHSPPPNYLFSPIAVLNDPFEGPSLVPDASYTPRPYEPFFFTFKSSSATAVVTHVGFSQGPLEACTPDVHYVTPFYFHKNTSARNTFTASLNVSGRYTLHLGMSENVLDPNITKPSSLVVGPCEPCSVTPPYAFLDEEVSLTFTSSQKGLSKGDALRLIPKSQDLSDLPCENPAGPYRATTFTPAVVASDGSSASFTVYTGNPAESSDYLGGYYLCYRKSNGTSAKGNFAIVSDDSGLKAVFSIYPVDLVTVQGVCPEGDKVHALETVVFNLTVLDREMYPDATFDPKDEFRLVPLTDASSKTCEDASNVLAQHTAEDSEVVLPILDAYGNAYSNWYATIPIIPRKTSYLLCFKLQYGTTFRSVSNTNLSIQTASPYVLYTTPSVILPESTNAVINVIGVGMLAADEVYLVNSTESCAETCYRPLHPVEWDGGPEKVTFKKEYINDTLLHITFDGAIKQVLTFSVCYRRAGYLLTRVGNVHVGEPNPTSWVTNFVPRAGTRPTLTFTGKDLTKEDRAMIVPFGGRCYEGDAVADADFLSMDDPTKQTASFYLDLTNVAQGKYVMCYLISTVGGYVEMKQTFKVLPGGPSVFTTSNTPMRWRATVVLIQPDTATNPYTPQLNDEAYITNAEQSCFDEVHATVPYGTPYAKITNISNPMQIRVGFSADSAYIVCYKLADSGYARVGFNYLLNPTPSSPTTVEWFPSLTHQGQRLVYNFSGYTKHDAVDAQDEVMLVERARGCWDTAAMSASQILVSPSPLVYIQQGKQSLGMWRAHVPSLGPDVPKNVTFPCAYTLCYRAANQAEYVPVPVAMLFQSPDFDTRLDVDSSFYGGSEWGSDIVRDATAEAEFVFYAADPPTFTTQPATVRVGMIDVRVAFPNAQAGDTAYAVWFETLTNEVCTSHSTLISVVGSAYPQYSLSLPGNLSAGDNHVALCYTKVGGSVAEVPQMVPVLAGNPSGYQMNTTTPLIAFERSYIVFTISGEGLNPEEDAVVFSETSCGLSARPLNSTPALARLGAMEGVADGVQVVAQFRSRQDALQIFICYAWEGVWREVGDPFALWAADPSTAQLERSPPLSHAPRVGQHLSLSLTSATVLTLAEAAVLAESSASGAGTWCHNFTARDVWEPGLTGMPPLLEVPVWQHAGVSRLCVRVAADTPWMDLAASVEGVGLTTVMGPNPARMEIFPTPPRVGQQVTLVFHLAVGSAAGDRVRISAPGYQSACDTAPSVVGFSSVIPVTVVDKTTTRVTLVDGTDTLAYRSFNTTGAYLVCYYSALEEVWGVAGGTFTAGTLDVQEQVPQHWELKSGTLVQFQNFVLRFDDELGQLHGSDGDLAWATPSGQNCGVDPYSCTQCIVFNINAAVSTPNSVVTEPNASILVDNLNVCYRPAGATASMVGKPIEISAGPIQCVENTTMTLGMRQIVTFMIKDGTNVEEDSWRVSFYNTSARECQSHYVPEFLPSMVQKGNTTATTASYIVNWPLNLFEDRYRVCYHHNDVVTPICTCEQINAKNGECYIGMKTFMESFTPKPDPSYVGQSIELALTLAADSTMYPPTAIKLVRYVDELTACDAPAAFDPHGVLTKIDNTMYKYVFKHNYKLDPGAFLVCALTELSADYMRVAKNSMVEHHDNLLWIRPYLKLETFPSLSDYLRAMQVLSLRITHQSKLKDDTVSLGDSFTFVSDPNDCIEEYINQQDPNKELQKFYLDDSAFDSIPAPVESIDKSKFESRSTLTFNEKGVANQCLCYKLEAGTWAPVFPVLSIQSALTKTSECVLAENANKENAATDLVPRAMQFMLATIEGTADFARLYTKSDAVRVVPQGQPCVKDTVVVFTSSETHPWPTSNLNVSVIAFAGVAGEYKVCYRIGGPASDRANWSPICQHIRFASPSPIANVSGCFLEGQSIDVTVAHQGNFTFNADDKVRYVGGGEPCLHADGSLAHPLQTITLNDAGQPVDGFMLGPDAAGKNSVSLPYALLGSQTSKFSLCYRDASDREFAVPINYKDEPAAWIFVVQARQPSTIAMFPPTVQLGQRIVLNFTARGGATAPVLTPYGPFLNFPSPGPVFNGTFDAAALLPLEEGVAYREGRCTAAARGSGLELYGVYGTSPQPPYTLGVYDPKVGGKQHIACYSLMSCSAADIGGVLYVMPYNPANAYITPSKPRQGQMMEVHFTRDDKTPDAAFLSPDHDFAIIQENLSSCWALSTDAGVVVSGTPSEVYITALFPARSPGKSKVLTTRLCYRPVAGTWLEVPNGVASVLPANPSEFTTEPEVPRQNKLNTIIFTGSGLSLGDHVKIILPSLACNETSKPPDDFVAYDAAMKPLKGSSNGWQVTTTSTDDTITALNISTSVQGEYNVCYKLKDDTVWTLVYKKLRIHEQNPSRMTQTPVSTLEGEMFTLNFTSTENGIDASSDAVSLNAKDRVAVYLGGDVNCITPNDTAVIVTGPSRTDLLPSSISFQLSIATQGRYTVCYLSLSDALSYTGVGGYSPVWGFAPIVVNPNPQRVEFFPRVATPTAWHQPQELVSLVFSGFGLSTLSGKSDEVRLISASLPDSHESCFNHLTPTELHLYQFIANGSYAVQPLAWLKSNDDKNSKGDPAFSARYWVCYKLSGGQYHIIGEAALSILGAASPSAATASKPTSAIAIGEAVGWTLLDNTACATGDVLYYSATGCNDRPYYDMPPLASRQDLLALFPWGASWVNCSASQTSVRVPYTAGSLAQESPKAAAAQDYPKLSLCYYHNGSTSGGRASSISVLGLDMILLNAGVPPVLPQPLTGIQAGRIFSFKLDVQPESDLLVLTTTPAACSDVGTPIENAALFVTMNYDTTLHRLVVVTAVPAAGTYYICYSHRVKECEPSYGRDCARVVGEIRATAANLVGWKADSVPVYASEPLYITLVSDGALVQEDASLWMRQLPVKQSRRKSSAPTMADVAAACLESHTENTRAGSAQVTFTYESSTGKWNSTEPIKYAGSYALCYNDAPIKKSSNIGVLRYLSKFLHQDNAAGIAIFYPVANAGPVVEPSRVSSVVFQNPPAVGEDAASYVVLVGSGLSKDDLIDSVGVPPSSSSYSLLLASDTSGVPSDICTNPQYTPRVPGKLTSTSAVGDSHTASEMRYGFTFQETGGYMLCYTSAEARRAQQPGSPITPNGFAVIPTVSRVTVNDKVSLVKVPINLTISGNGLCKTDLAALAWISSLGKARQGVTLDASEACDSDQLNFTPAVNTDKDGKTATYQLTPAAEGNHVVCYKIQPGGGIVASAQQLPGVITVKTESAAEAVFVIQPASCETFLACQIQPEVELRDKSGKPVASPGVKVQMILAFAKTGKPTPKDYLLGGDTFINKEDTTFDFVALSISTVGKYYMIAQFTLPEGRLLQVNSVSFTVEDSHITPKSIAIVNCLPVGINPDRVSQINCTCEGMSSAYIPTNYSITVSAGTATPCIDGGKTSKGLPRCTFNVTPPSSTGGSGVPPNYLSIVVRNVEPYAGWPVDNSPVVVRLPSLPDKCTTLSCEAPTPSTDHTQLPADYVRVGDTLRCTVQGCAVVNRVTINVVVPASKLRVMQTYAFDGANKTDAIDIGAYPDDPNGLYSFNVTVGSALRIAVDGSVILSSTTKGHGESESSAIMTGSPQLRTILGVPTAKDSVISCVSNTSGSRTWFLATEAITCVVRLANHNGRVNGIGSDLELLMPQGGTATALNPMVVSTELTITATAPGSAPERLASTFEEGTLQDSIIHRELSLFNSMYDFEFTVQINFRPEKGLTLGTYTGKLVYVRAMTNPLPDFVAGESVSIDLVGSGLDTLHRYVISGNAACEAGPSGLQKATASVVRSPTQATRLSFTVPQGSVFYLCVAPQDSPEHLQLLILNPFLLSGNQHSGWARDDLILLIIGIIFLVILLVLLLVLLYCICCVHGGIIKRQRQDRGARPRSTVYIPPMANDRFLWRGGTTTAPPVTSHPNAEDNHPAQATATTPSANLSTVHAHAREAKRAGPLHHDEVAPVALAPSSIHASAQESRQRPLSSPTAAPPNPSLHNTLDLSRRDGVDPVGDAVPYRTKSKHRGSKSTAPHKEAQPRHNSDSNQKKHWDTLNPHPHHGKRRSTSTSDVQPPSRSAAHSEARWTSDIVLPTSMRETTAFPGSLATPHARVPEKRLIHLDQPANQSHSRTMSSPKVPVMPMLESMPPPIPQGAVGPTKQREEGGNNPNYNERDPVVVMGGPFIASGHTSRPMVGPQY